MGIDWEGILDAEGADMADAYDALVFDAYDNEEAWDEEELQNVEDSAELAFYDSDGTPPPFAEADSIGERIPDAGDDMETIQQQRRDIQKLIVILIENDIPIPGDIIDKYIKRSSPVNSEEQPEHSMASEFDDEDLPF